MTRRLPSAVLFDLDGTLADTAADLAASACDALGALGLAAPSPLALHGHGSRGGRGMLRAAWPGEIDDVLFGRAFALFLERYAERMFETTTLYPGVSALLEQLQRRGIPWGIVTNKGQRYTRPLVAHLGLRPATLFCGDMVERPKPAPDGLHAAADALGVAAADCVYVGDDGKDVAAARAAGMPAVVAAYGYSTALADPGLAPAHARIDRPAELLQVLDARVTGA